MNAEHLVRHVSRYASLIPALAGGVAALPVILIVCGAVLFFGFVIIALTLFIIHAILGTIGTVLFFLALAAGIGFVVYRSYLAQQRARFIQSLVPSLNDYRNVLARYDLNDLPDGDFKETLQVHADFLAQLLIADAPSRIFNDLHIDPKDTRAVLLNLPLRYDHFNAFTLEDIQHIFPAPIDVTAIAPRLHHSIYDELTRRGDTILGEQYMTTPELQHTRADALIAIKQDIRFRHSHIIGKTGSGKSVLLQHLIAQDIANPNRGVIVLTPEDGIFQKLLPYIPDERHDDLIYYDPTDTRDPIVGFNCFDFKEAHDLPPLQREELITQRAGELYTIFSRALGDLGVKMTTLMQNVAFGLLQVPNATILDIDRLLHPHNTDLRDQITSDEAIDSRTRQFWTDYDGVNANYYKSTYTTVVNRLEPFFRPPLSLTFTTPSINFGDVLNRQRPRIIFLNISRLRGVQAQIAGQLLIAEIQQSLQRRENIPEADRTPYYFYVDEFALFASSEGAFIDLFARARKYRMACCVAHQTTSDINGQFLDVLIGNVATVCAMQLSAGDAPYFAKELQLFEANEIRRRQITEREAAKLNSEARRTSRETGRQVDPLSDPYEVLRLTAKIKDYAGGSPSPAILQNLPVGKAIIKTVGFNYGTPVSVPFFKERPPASELIERSKQNYGISAATDSPLHLAPHLVGVNGSAPMLAAAAESAADELEFC